MNIKGVEIGAGQPKVVVSFTNHSKETIDEEIESALSHPGIFDIVEIRSDAFDALSHEEHINLINHINQIHLVNKINLIKKINNIKMNSLPY